MECPNCGREISDTALQCYFCDAYVKEGAEEELKKRKKRNKQEKVKTVRTSNFKVWRFICGLLLGLVLSGFSLFITISVINKRDLTIGAVVGIILGAIVAIITTILSLTL